jgi:hypothetical protein
VSETPLAPEYDRGRFAELMLYVAAKCAADPSFGATKLNKILFYSDFIAFETYGVALTGATYQKLERGPAPKQLLPALRELENKREAALTTQTYFGRTQKRVVALRAPDLRQFSATELKLVDDVIDTMWGRSANLVSELSHLERGWQIVDMNDEIPYWTVFIDQDQTMSVDDIAWAQRVASEEHASGLDQASAS